MKKQITDLLNHISALGSKEITLIYPIFFYLIEEIQIVKQIILGLILCYIIAIPIRIFYFKKRPIEKSRNNLLQKIEANSFPSMHSTRSTLLLLILLNYFQYKIEFIIFFTIIYVTILYARIFKKRHDYTDLIGGIFLGIICYNIINLIL